MIPETFRHCGAASRMAAVVAVMGISLQSSAAFHGTRSGALVVRESADNPSTPMALAGVVTLVEQYGVPADLGRLCRAFGLPEFPADCWFKQIAVDTDQVGGEHHAFNVASEDPHSSYLVMFRLRPLIGEFFAASPQGDLLAALFRARGADYRSLSDEDARAQFVSELAFWRRNMRDVKRQVESTQQSASPGKKVQP